MLTVINNVNIKKVSDTHDTRFLQSQSGHRQTQQSSKMIFTGNARCFMTGFFFCCPGCGQLQQETLISNMIFTGKAGDLW